MQLIKKWKKLRNKTLKLDLEVAADEGQSEESEEYDTGTEVMTE